ncbi:Hypothetical predicted protein [Paramuricea clavata]|uniref:Uncharacterized protein n=1 Tax=Paramuricea clavata TaxID=317549 RepID=A0A7D9J038_PARCT|nr:Hypothetical predicted protein [Paramuricea clavata]
MTTLPQDINESLRYFEEEWKRLAKEIRSSYEWKEMSVYRPNKTPPTDKKTTIYKVLTTGESRAIPVGTLDASNVEIKAHLQKNSKKMLSMLCLLLGNICSEGGKINVSRTLRKKKNLDNLNYIKIDVIDDYEFLMPQLNKTSIDFYLQLNVNGKFVVVRRYTISFSSKRGKRSAWSGFTEHSIPYEYLMPDYNQHKMSTGCYSGCTPVGWAQIFAYYDRVAHRYGYRYSTSHWRGKSGVSGYSSYEAPGSLNSEVERYVEALGVPLRTNCGSTTMRNTDNVDAWFRARQGSGKVIWISRSNIIKQQVSLYVIRNKYPVLNSIYWYGSSGDQKTKSGHDVVVTKVKQRSRQYKSCRKVGWWWGRRTKCEGKTEYEYEWYRRMGWGGRKNNWYPASATGAFVAVL